MWRHFARAPARLSLTTVFAATALAVSALAAPDASDWAASTLSSMRLLSAGGVEGGRYLAGVEIQIKGQGHTYWRHPGDGGVPPVFSFAGSRNLKSAEVRFPAPKRIVEGGMDVFGYGGSVIFPLDVTPDDPAKPVELSLKLQYAACDKICVPAEGEAKLRLEPKDAAGSQAERIKEFLARTPVVFEHMPTGARPSITITPLPGDKPAWMIAISPAPPAGADLFADAPGDWFFDTRPASGGFRLELAQRPSDARDGKVDVTLTHTFANGAWEARISLDAGPPKP